MSLSTSSARDCVNDTTTDQAPDLLVALWASLLAGTSHVRVFTTSTHYELLVSPSGRSGRASSRRDLAARVFDRVLRGERQKVVALSLGLSGATIAQTVGEVARDMNLEQRFSRLPAPVVMLAHAAQHPSWLMLEVRGELSWQQQPERVVRVSHCARLLGNLLTSSQRDVARQLLEGETHAQIAARRHTSLRTVANQLAQVFRAFGVTGRFELLRALCERRAGTPAAARIGIQDPLPRGVSSQKFL